MFIRASEQQRQAYGYTAESKCVTITANVRILQDTFAFRHAHSEKSLQVSRSLQLSETYNALAQSYDCNISTIIIIIII